MLAAAALDQEQQPQDLCCPKSRSAAAGAFSSIPIIDVTPIVNNSVELEDPKVKDVIGKIDDACRNVGFFYVKGHGVPSNMMEQVRELAHKFFQLSSEEKSRVKMTPASGWRGYQELGENVTNGLSDLHEAIDFFHDYGGDFPVCLQDHPLRGRNLWPDIPGTFQPLYTNYIHALQGLGRSIMRAISLALTGKLDTFEDDRAGNSHWILRVIGYPPIKNKVAGVGCGAHTDYGLLTLVNQDDGIRSLQVMNQAGDWIWADPIPGTFVVNIGDMLKIWSNGIYMPTVHRVLNSDSKYRVSVPYFYEPNFDAVVEPLEECMRMTEHPKFPRVVYGDHLTKKVLNNFK